MVTGIPNQNTLISPSLNSPIPSSDAKTLEELKQLHSDVLDLKTQNNSLQKALRDDDISFSQIDPKKVAFFGIAASLVGGLLFLTRNKFWEIFACMAGAIGLLYGALPFLKRDN